MRTILKNKRGVAIASQPILMVVSLMAGLLTILHFSGFLNVNSVATIVGGSPSTDSVWVAQFGSFTCQENTVEDSLTRSLDNSVPFTCGSGTGSIVDDCRVFVSCGNTPFYSPSCSGNYKVNNGGWVRYTVQENQNLLITKVNPEDRVEFDTGFGPTNKDVTEIKYEWNKYNLHQDEGNGFKSIANSFDCCLTNQANIDEYQVEREDWKCIEKGVSHNYFYDWRASFGQRYNYNGNTVLCSERTLYGIDSRPMADGKTYQFQGNPIKAVDCCPHEDASCGNDFKFVTQNEVGEQTCSISSQCDNGGKPVATSDEKALIESCIGGVCVQDELNIECASNSKCRSLYGDNYVCSLAYNNNFGQCFKTYIGQEYCGNGICAIGETFNNCIEDCEIQCPEGEKIVREVSKQNCAIPILNIGCDEITRTKCESDSFNFFGLGIFVIIVLLIFIFRKPLLALTKRWIPF